MAAGSFAGSPSEMCSKEDQRVRDREETELDCKNMEEADRQDPDILEEIEIEDFAVDGICGVY
jgi:mycofactocin precursor